MSQDQQPNAPVELHFEYAWRWFALHANQRISMFHFFLIGTGILANAYVLLIRESFEGMAGGLAIVGALVSIVFALLDRRNRQLVHMGEEVLKDLESRVLFPIAQPVAGQSPAPRGILQREAVNGEPSFYLKHWFLIEGLQAVGFIGFVIAAVFAFFQ